MYLIQPGRCSSRVKGHTSNDLSAEGSTDYLAQSHYLWREAVTVGETRLVDASNKGALLKGVFRFGLQPHRLGQVV